MNKLKIKLQDLGEGTYLFLATCVVNIFNYGLNLILGRWLGPEGFSEANLIATLVMVLSFIGMGLQLTAAKVSVEGNSGLVKFMLKQVSVYSVLVVVILLTCALAIKSFLNFQSTLPLIILFIGIPFYFNMSIARGYFQGQSNFRKLARTYLVEMASRVATTIILLYIFIDQGLASEVVAFGFLVSFVVCYGLSKPDISAIQISKQGLKKIIAFMSIVAFYELSQIVINNSDVILVKHYFDSYEAGLYASLALIGRIVFFATWTVVTILFPKVIEKEKKGEPHEALFWNALLIVGVLGLVMTFGAYLFGNLIVTIAFGAAYSDMSILLWIYTLFTSLFACANVFAYYHMSLENYIPVIISVIAGCIQILLIIFFHSSLESVLFAQLAAMLTMLLVMIGYHLYYREETRSQLVTAKNYAPAQQGL